LEIKDQLVTVTRSWEFIFVAGYFDYSFFLFRLENGAFEFVDQIFAHMDIITCLNLSKCEEWLVTGSRDTTVRIWRVIQTEGRCIISKDIVRVLYGHDGPVINSFIKVTHVLVDSDVNVVVSGSQDGTIIIHHLHHSNSPVSINVRQKLPGLEIRFLALTPILCDIVVVAKIQERFLISRYSINGRLIMSAAFTGTIYNMIISPDSKFLILALDNQITILDSIRYIIADLASRL
jgi:WD40 repeat protein